MSDRLVRKVAIAGAGIGGLCAAVSLLQRGIDVEVYEQADSLRELGAGLLISMNAMRVLEALGLESAARSIDLPAVDRVVRLWNTGTTKSVYQTQTETQRNHTVCMIHRAELQRILAEAAQRIKPDVIRFGARVLGARSGAADAELLLEGGESAHADAVVGADGVHSMVRTSLYGQSAGRYTGSVAWRGLVPIERLAPVHRRPIATTWIGPQAHITCYPMRFGSGHLVSFSAQVERARWERESWSEVGTVSEALQDFIGWHPEVQEMIRGAETLYKWGLFVRDPLPHWSVGRVTLLGDACHSMVPYLGQGVVMAMEDAFVLARCLSGTAPGPQEALQQYEKARYERGNRAASASAAMQHVFHHPDLAHQETAIPYMEANWSPQAIRERYEWLFQYDATRVPI